MCHTDNRYVIVERVQRQCYSLYSGVQRRHQRNVSHPGNVPGRHVGRQKHHGGPTVGNKGALDNVNLPVAIVVRRQTG
jgi:hypothetical protein